MSPTLWALIICSAVSHECGTTPDLSAFPSLQACEDFRSLGESTYAAIVGEAQNALLPSHCELAAPKVGI
jgi:hypothetical protein